MSYHLARHTFATLTLTKGVSIESVSKMLGHTNIKTTQIYARITDVKVSNDMASFAEKMEEKNSLWSNTFEKEEAFSFKPMMKVQKIAVNQ